MAAAKRADKQAPPIVGIGGLFAPIEGFNSAVEINHPSPDAPERIMPYNQDPDEGLASRRSKQEVRTFAELKAATGAPPESGYGLSLRSPMAGQAENDQFPLRTDPYGKQRA